MGRKYGQIREDGKNGFSKPFIPTHPNGIHHMGCCDCGLVHDMKFTAWLKVKGGYRKLSSRAAAVMIEARRNARATAGKRRSKKLKHIAAAIRKKTVTPSGTQ